MKLVQTAVGVELVFRNRIGDVVPVEIDVAVVFALTGRLEDSSWKRFSARRRHDGVCRRRRDELGRQARTPNHDRNEYYQYDSERYTRRIVHHSLRRDVCNANATTPALARSIDVVAHLLQG